MADPVAESLREWSKNLLDLTSRNRLLNIPKSFNRPATLELVLPDPGSVYTTLADDKTLKIISPPDLPKPQLVSSNGPDLDLTDESPPEPPEDAIDSDNQTYMLNENEVLTRLQQSKSDRVIRRLVRQSRESIQEQGVNVLYAAFGVLEWQESGSQDSVAKAPKTRNSPLILMPLSISANPRTGTATISAEDESPAFNLTLLERVRQEFGFSLVDLSAETDALDYCSTLEIVRRSVADRDDWKVKDEVHVGIFQFYKLRMYRDLQENLELASNHDVISTLTTPGSVWTSPIELIPEDFDLDREVRPDDTFSILDADASQMRVIQQILRGSTLVVQGPPGTGKSQTIANAIAELAARGKTVLFVSEKSAALEVVYKRLETAGLANLTLALHSHKANKAEIIGQLYRSMEHAEGIQRTDDVRFDAAAVDFSRRDINAYPEALHALRAPLGASIFEGIGEIARLQMIPDFPALDVPDFPNMSRARLAEWEGIVQRVAIHRDALMDQHSNPWRLISEEIRDANDVARIRAALARTEQAVVRLLGLLPSLGSVLSLDTPATLGNCLSLMQLLERVPRGMTGLRAQWIDSGSRQRALPLAREVSRRVTSVHNQCASLLKQYSPEILNLPHDDLMRSLEAGTLTRLFSSSVRTDERRVRSLLRDGSKPSRDDMARALADAKSIQHEMQWLSEQSGSLSELFGRNVGALDQLSRELWERDVDTLEQLDRLAIDHPSLNAASGIGAALLSDSSVRGMMDISKQVSENTTELQKQEAYFGLLLPVSKLPGGYSGWKDQDLTTVGIWASTLQSQVDLLDPWLRARSAVRDAETHDLGEIVSAFLDRDLAPDLWPKSLRKLVWRRFVESGDSLDAEIRDFNGLEREKRVSRFRELDRSLVSTGAKRLISRRTNLGSRLIGSISTGTGEAQFLAYEFNKKRRHVPLRKLFHSVPNLAMGLKPVMMMSPLSIAQYLPAETMTFDVVVFDEASQVRPHDALGAIMRGRQVVVVGDSNQLPPTSFFDRTDASDVEDEQQIEQDVRQDVESILNAMLSRQFPHRTLTWHYRSRHEDLIAFSNHHIYRGGLVTFPTPTHDKDPNYGVHFEHVADGKYLPKTLADSDRPTRVNMDEAKRIVELIVQHAHEFPTSSLMVVALGEHQANAIEDAVNSRKLIDRHLDDWISGTNQGAEPFAVKALEKVQGDERDIIIISIGFAKNEHGQLKYQFGPINQEVGRRRLNVLVTRARDKIIVVSSIRAQEMADARIAQSHGAQMLKSYLDFAENGPSVLPARVTSDEV